MKNLKKFLMIILVIFVVAIPTLSIADFGDFESYDSDWESDWDSDWGSSYDSDWGSSSYSGGYYYGDDLSGGGFFVIIVIAMIIFIVVRANMDKRVTKYSRPNMSNYNGTGYVRNTSRSKEVAQKVIDIDSHFNEEIFISNAKNLFVKLQNAWSERNLETLRPLVSAELFDQYSKNVQSYIDNKKINKLERIATNYGELVSFYQDNEKDTLIVAVNSSMVDYIMDEEKGVILKGDNSSRITNTYKMTFTRKKGILTEEGTAELKTTNCPNCGAPTTITSSGRCPYCNSVITTGSHDWVLSGIERY
ncbi:MAG: TIM44-like domain-containing protein [Clostridia bacterium]|nr:TIM44-like domain-containing protein [Clostridia bacterium]